MLAAAKNNEATSTSATCASSGAVLQNMGPAVKAEVHGLGWVGHVVATQTPQRGSDSID